MESTGSTRKGPSHRNFAAFFLLLVLIISIYGNTFDASWHLDDYQNIQTNSRIHITNLEPGTLWKTFFSNSKKPGTLYRPIPCLTFALNWYFGQDKVFGYHLVNMAVHFVTGFFLFLTILHLFHSPNLRGKYQGKEYFIALLAALLWAINPIQTQGVTYIVQRMASMAAMFYIMGIYFYVRARNADIRREQIWFFVGCFLSFLFALGSKQNAATLPIALLLVEMLFYRDVGHPKIKKFFVPIFLGGGLVIIALGIVIFKPDNPLFFLDSCRNRPFSSLEHLLTEARIVVMYLSQIFYPMPNRLSIEHDIAISKSLFNPWTTLPSILLLFSLVAVGFWQMKKRPVLGFAILFFFLNHLIESSIICLELVFEHRNYLPSLFLFFPIALGIRKLLDYYENRASMYYILVTFVTLLIVGLGCSTYIRNLAWKDDGTLWGDAVSKAPESPRALHNLAWGYYEKINRYDMAIRLYKEAADKEMDHTLKGKVVSFSNIAGLYKMTGRYEGCVEYAKMAIEIAPDYGKAYYKLASCQVRLGQWDEALKTINIILKHVPGNHKYLTLKGFVLLKNGKYQEALDSFRKALRHKPDSTKALINMGLAMSRLGHYERALWFLKRVHSISPGNSSVLLSLMEVNLKAGRKAEAEEYAEELFDLKGPERVRSLVVQLSEDNMSIPLSVKTMVPIIAPRIEQGSEELAGFADELRKASN